MSLKAYEDACIRAELFGQPKPEKDEFLEKHKHLDIVEFEEVELKNAKGTAKLTEDLRAARGQFAELHSLMSSPHHKINKLKGVCGSLTRFFRAKVTARENLSYSSDPSYVGQPGSSSSTRGLGPNDGEMTGTIDKSETIDKSGTIDKPGCSGNDINTALSHLDEMEDNKSLMKSNVKEMKGQIGKLDGMLQRSDTAQMNMSALNKDMRSIAKR